MAVLFVFRTSVRVAFNRAVSVRRRGDSAKTTCFFVRINVADGFGAGKRGRVTPVSHVCNMLYVLAS